MNIMSLSEFEALSPETCNERKNDVQKVITDWLETFIKNNKPWHAFSDNHTFYEPIPVHQDFFIKHRPYHKKTNNELKFYWPELPEEVICEVLEDLGFVVLKNDISLTVPVFKENQPTTFAQKWVKKINDSYSS